MKISEWLMSLRTGITVAIDCTVTIEGQQFQACEYHQTRVINPGCPAYDRGEREHDHHALYIVGPRPKAVKARMKRDGDSYPPKYYFRRVADERDWYLAGYCDSVPEDRKEYHPFGPSFMLCPWTVPDGTAPDHYQEKKAERLTITVE